jgi:hypothetical protein
MFENLLRKKIQTYATELKKYGRVTLGWSS